MQQGESPYAETALAIHGPLAQRQSPRLITGWTRFDSWVVHQTPPVTMDLVHITVWRWRLATQSGNKNMNKHKITTSRRVGEPSSKYGYQPELFERDLERRQRESEALWQEFRAWMMKRKVDPENLRYLFLRLHEEFLE